MKILPFVTQLIIGLDIKIIARKICFIVEFLFISFYPLVFFSSPLQDSADPVLRGRFPLASHNEHNFKIKIEWKITKKKLNKWKIPDSNRISWVNKNKERSKTMQNLIRFPSSLAAKLFGETKKIWG